MEQSKKELFLNTKKTSPRLQDIAELIKSITVTEGNPLVRYKMKDSSMVIVDIKKNIIYNKSPEGQIVQKSINKDKDEDKNWLEFSLNKKKEKTGEVYH